MARRKEKRGEERRREEKRENKAAGVGEERQAEKKPFPPHRVAQIFSLFSREGSTEIKKTTGRRRS